MKLKVLYVLDPTDIYFNSIQKGAAYAHRISILFSAVFMIVTGTGSLAQNTITDDDANEQSPVCLTHKISDAPGHCRIAFMQAFNTLSQKGGNGKALNKASNRYVNEYMSACGCSSECRQ
jgi:hypothetical protein